jgi:hypothetical protein
VREQVALCALTRHDPSARQLELSGDENQCGLSILWRERVPRLVDGDARSSVQWFLRLDRYDPNNREDGPEDGFHVR